MKFWWDEEIYKRFRKNNSIIVSSFMAAGWGFQLAISVALAYILIVYL